MAELCDSMCAMSVASPSSRDHVPPSPPSTSAPAADGMVVQSDDSRPQDAGTMDFEREKIAFEQNCESFRSLNQLMWQVPLIATSLTGGLWYGVANSGLHQLARGSLLLLATLANAALGLLVLPRVRSVMDAHLKSMKEFHSKSFPVAPPSWVPFFGKERGTMRVYAALLSIAAALSLIGFCAVVFGKWPVSPKPLATEHQSPVLPASNSASDQPIDSGVGPSATAASDHDAAPAAGGVVP
jgi:hypothetical protein